MCNISCITDGHDTSTRFSSSFQRLLAANRASNSNGGGDRFGVFHRMSQYQWCGTFRLNAQDMGQTGRSRSFICLNPIQYAVMLPALPTGKANQSGEEPRTSQISKAAVF